MTTMTPEEKRNLSNALYNLLCPILYQYETRGFNSHAKTQGLMEHVISEMDYWISIQPQTPGGDL